MPITARYVNGPPLKFGNLILSYTFRLDNASGSRNRISVVRIERSAIGIYMVSLYDYINIVQFKVQRLKTRYLV